MDSGKQHTGQGATELLNEKYRTEGYIRVSLRIATVKKCVTTAGQTQC